MFSRSLTLSTGGQRTWIDTSVPLYPGLLTTFYVYISNQAFLAQTTFIHLQIWRPTTIANMYTLVWDLRSRVVLTYPAGALYTVRSHLLSTVALSFSPVHFVSSCLLNLK